MGYSSIHLNMNLLCCVDVETTGLDFSRHEILQICILPLGPDLIPTREFPFFYVKIKPEKIEEIDDGALKLHRRLVTDCLLHGMERWSAVARLEEWFSRLKIPPRKSIVPLGCNYGGFDRDFLREFLGGPASYRGIFRDDYRDVMLAALHHNDLADWHTERCPFPKVNLRYLASQLGIQHIGRHDAMSDCIITAEVYRRMMRYKDVFTFASKQQSCQHSWNINYTCETCAALHPNYDSLIRTKVGAEQLPSEEEPSCKLSIEDSITGQV